MDTYRYMVPLCCTICLPGAFSQIFNTNELDVRLLTYGCLMELILSGMSVDLVFKT